VVGNLRIGRKGLAVLLAASTLASVAAVALFLGWTAMQGGGTPDTAAILERALRLPAVDRVASIKFDPSLIDSEGAVGPNQLEWTNPRLQGEGAYWGSIVAIKERDGELADRALRAVELALEHQLPDGSFEGGSPDDDLKFTGQALAALTLLQNSPWSGQLANRMDGVLASLHQTALWVEEQAELLVDPETEYTNVKAALAFILLKVGHHNSDTGLVETGEEYLSQVFNNQDPSGYFLEKDGWDTSYQMVTCRLLYFIYLSDFCSSQLRATIASSLQLAFEWEKQRIDPDTGRVDDTGNTRTANEVENSPEGKLINYFEVAMALAYLYSLGFEGAGKLAEAVSIYGEENQPERGGCAAWIGESWLR